MKLNYDDKIKISNIFGWEAWVSEIKNQVKLLGGVQWTQITNGKKTKGTGRSLKGKK